jgi:SPP1 gp7 family putative phage head morphogenesis protein
MSLDGLAARTGNRLARMSYARAVSGDLEGLALDFAVDLEHSIGAGIACALDSDAAARKLVQQMPQRQRDAVDAFYAQLARGVADATAARARNKLVGDLAETVHLKPAERRARIKRALIELGIKDAPDGVVQSIIKTQGAIAYNAAIWVHSQRNPLVWGYELVTEDDERVRPVHESMNGIRYPKQHRFWRRNFPPNGWGCRCKGRPIMHGDSDARIKLFKGGREQPEIDREFRFCPGMIFAAR